MENENLVTQVLRIYVFERMEIENLVILLLRGYTE